MSETRQAIDHTRKEIWPDDFARPPFPYSPGVSAGGWVFTSAQMATDLVTGLSPEAAQNPRNPHLVDQDPVELQSWVVMKRLSGILDAAGCDIGADSVRIQQWRPSDHPTIEEFAQGSTWTGLNVSPYYRARNSYIPENRPASTGMGVRRLPLRDGRIAVDMIGLHPSDGHTKEGIDVPEGVPAPLAGYSPAIRRGDWVFLAGEIPTDWQGDWMSERFMGTPSSVAPHARVNPFFWYGSPIELETEYTLTKLERIAEAAGTSLDRCVKANVYLGDPSDYQGMDRVWKKWFPDSPPARVVIPYMGLGGKGCRIEIDMTLLTNESELERTPIEASGALEPLGHEPHALRVGELLFFSTQLAAGREGLADELRVNPELPFFTDTAKLQAEKIYDNMSTICEAAGTTLENVCAIKEFYDDLSSFAAVRDTWPDWFTAGAPASTSVEVGASLIAPDCHLLLDAIGYVPPA